MSKKWLSPRATVAALLLFLVPAGLFAQKQPQQNRGIGRRMQPGEVGVVNLAASKSGLRNFQMDSTYRNGRLLMRGFTATLGTGTIRAAGSVDWSNSRGPHHLKIELHDVEIVNALKVFDIVLDAQVLGKVSGTLDVTWDGLKGRSLRQSLSGRGDFRLGAGSVSDLDILNQVSAMTGISELQSFKFESGAITADIRQGTMFITMPSASSSFQRMTAKGTLNLPSDQIDVAGQLSLSRALAKRSTYPAVRVAAGLIDGLEGGKKSAGFIEMPFVIRMAGDVEDPKFAIESLETQSAPRQPEKARRRSAGKQAAE